MQKYKELNLEPGDTLGESKFFYSNCFILVQFNIH